jgi:DNA-binding transcriptional LysR family regulator
VELKVHHLLSVHQIDAVLSGRLDVGFAASMTPWHKGLAHSPIAEDRMMLAVPKGHALAGSGEHAVHLVSAVGQSGVL